MTVYSAKWVVPMDGSPIIENGEVVLQDGLIEAVRPVQTPESERIDLGNSVILPGLVNAHTHLEYTALRGFLEDVPFFPWVRALNAAKSHLASDDWITSAKLGALECLASGTTTIADNTDSGAALDAAVWSGIRGRIYQEFFCIDQRTVAGDVAEDLAQKLKLLNLRKSARLEVGISPHATYTINPAMFRVIREDARLRGLPISIHVAESLAESSLTEQGEGEFAEMFHRRGIVWESPHVSPTRYVADQGVLGEKTLLIHGVQQNDEDIDITARSGAAVIHCPKSNAKLGAGIAPLDRWLKTDGLRLGIGTDSAVSNNTLDLFEEMRFALLLQRGTNHVVEQITAMDVLELATVRGAQAVGLSSIIGSLSPGKRADFIAVSMDGLHMQSVSDPVHTLVYCARAADVSLTVIDGEVRYDRGQFNGLDENEVRLGLLKLREKILAARN